MTLMECYQQHEEETLRSVVEYKRPQAPASASREVRLRKELDRNSHRAANRESAATGKSDAALSVAPPGLEPKAGCWAQPGLS
jgi:hypothetical protein